MLQYYTYIMTETQKNILIIAITIAAAVGIAVGIFTIVSHVAYRRSNKATLIELFFRIMRFKRAYKKSGYDKYMKKLDNSACPRPKKLVSKTEKHEFCGADVYTLSRSENPERIIIYLHGGAYIRHGTKYSWLACDRIAQKTNSLVVYPLYPIAPQSDHRQAYDLLQKLYKEVIEKTDKPIIVMGDSAGGGLAFGLCELLQELGMPQPSELIAFSPWLDITLSNEEISKIEPHDAMLASYGAVEIGKLWAAGCSPTDYKLSPIYGDVSGLSNVYIFGGTREILYPDIVKMHDKLISSGVNATLYTGVNMPHDYPLYPMPEGKRAIDKVCEIITEN